MERRRIPTLFCMVIGLVLFVQNVSAGAGRSKDANHGDDGSDATPVSRPNSKKIVLEIDASEVDDRIEVCTKIHGITRYFVKESASGIITTVRVSGKSLSFTDAKRNVTTVLCASNFDDKFTVQFSDNTSKEYVVEQDGIKESGKSGAGTASGASMNGVSGIPSVRSASGTSSTDTGPSTSGFQGRSSSVVGNGNSHRQTASQDVKHDSIGDTQQNKRVVSRGQSSQGGNTAQSGGSSSGSSKKGGVPVKKRKKSAVNDASNEVDYSSQNTGSSNTDVDPMNEDSYDDVKTDGDVAVSDAVKDQVKTGTKKLVDGMQAPSITPASQTNGEGNPNVIITSGTDVVGHRSSGGERSPVHTSGGDSRKGSVGVAQGDDNGLTLNISGANPKFDEFKFGKILCYRVKKGCYIYALDIKSKMKTLGRSHATVACFILEKESYSVLVKTFEEGQWKDMYFTKVGDGEILRNASIKQKFAALELQSVLDGAAYEKVTASGSSVNVQDSSNNDKNRVVLKQQQQNNSTVPAPEKVEKKTQQTNIDVLKDKDISLGVPKGMKKVQMRVVDGREGKYRIVSFKGNNVVKHKKYLHDVEPDHYIRVPYEVSRDYSLKESLVCFGLRAGVQFAFLNTLQIESSAMLYGFPIKKYGNISLVDIPSGQLDTIVLLSSHEVLLRADEKHRLVIVGDKNGVSAQITSEKNGKKRRIDITTGLEGTDDDVVVFA